MIRINKSPVAPAILSAQGANETNIFNLAHEANPSFYTSAVGVKNRSLKSFKIDSRIYGDSTVKDLLKEDQHKKCCFCESLFTDTSYGDVEHFRPKGAYKGPGKKGLVYPGYYWLAYDWKNLIFSCELCNRSYKKNEFPLGDESTRQLFHNHSNTLDNEDRLLIDPTIEDPADFIAFKQEVPVAVNGSLKGLKTIKILNLDRMNNARLERLNELKAMIILCKIDISDDNIGKESIRFNMPKDELIEAVINAKEVIAKAAKDDSKFAYCIRCNFPEFPVV